MTPQGAVELFFFIPTDMTTDYTLWMQKTNEGSAVKDSLGSFGFAVSEIPWPADETQDVASREWPGEHGEDAYISPDGLKLKAYDLEVEFLYKGAPDTAYSAYRSLRGYLTGTDGSGAELKIHDPYWRIGRTGVHVRKFGDIEPFRTNVDEGLSARVTFRVSDPMTEIGLGKDIDGRIVSLGAV